MAYFPPRTFVAALLLLPAFLSAQTAQTAPVPSGTNPTDPEEPMKMEAVEVTALGWFFVRSIAAVFDRFLQLEGAREKFSKII